LLFGLDGLGHRGDARGQASSFRGRTQHELGIRARHEALQRDFTKGPQLFFIQSAQSAQATGGPAP